MNYQAIIKKLFRQNSFEFRKPLIVVFRNTVIEDNSILYIPEVGSNICDTIFLVDDECIMLRGRSYPHEKYQKRMVEGTDLANYIATGFYPDVYKKGLHKGIRALVQNRNFVIWRSRDMEFRDEDDYNETGIVFDNFHGLAPYSAGCITVAGGMKPATDDWEIADHWIYTKNTEVFSAAVLNFSDILNPDISKLRVGSVGFKVEELQRRLCKFYRIAIDGEFGSYTHKILRQFQTDHNLISDGIYGPHTQIILEG